MTAAAPPPPPVSFRTTDVMPFRPGDDDLDLDILEPLPAPDDELPDARFILL